MSARAVAAPAPSRERFSSAPPRPRSRPRRLSGPARRTPQHAQRRRRAHAARAGRGAGIVLEALAALERLSRHRLLDRLIRGRVWIGLVAFALIGIVTLQLALLKLNGGVGRALAHQAVLQRENALLSVENSELASADQVQTKARSLGMEFASTGALRFLSASPAHDVPAAARALASPPHQSAEEPTAGAGASSEAQSASSSEGQSHEGSEASAAANSSEAGAPGSSGGGEGTQSASAPASGAGGEAAAMQGATAGAGGEGAAAGGAQAGH